MRRGSTILLLLFQFLNYPANKALGQVLPFHYYTTKDGLPSNEIHVIRQDSRGYIWIGTAEGVSAYDGNSFANYTTVDGLALDAINDIIEDRTSPGTMWIATNGGGVSKFENGTFTTYRMGSRFVSNSVNTLLQDRAGVIWCGADSGVFEIRNGVVSEFSRKNAFRGVNSIVEPNDSTLWFGCEPGLFCYSRRSDKLEVIDFREPENIVNKLCTDSNGAVWAATFGGNILEIQGRTIIRRCVTGLQKAQSYYTFHLLSDDGMGNLWACTRSGILKISKNNLSQGAIVQYTVDDGLQENGIRSFLIDREQNFWVGGGTNGLAKLAQKTIYRFPVPRGYLSLSSKSADVDSAGHVWIAATTGLLETWRDALARWHIFNHKTDRSEGKGVPVFVSCAAHGLLWVGRYKGSVQCFKISHRTGHESRLTLKRELVTGRDVPNGVVMFMVDRQGMLWFSADGVTAVDPDHAPHVKRTFTTADGLPPTSIRALYQDHDGNVWFGGGYGGGIAMLPRGDWTGTITQRYSLENGLPNDYIRAFGENGDGRLLIGTRYGGLAILNEGKFTTYTTNTGLLSNAVWCFATDDMGRTFLGTHLGLQFFDNASPIRFETNTDLTGNTVWACGTYKNQFAWMLTSDELTIFEYSKATPAPLVPPVYITSVKVNGDRIHMIDRTEFSHDQNNILVTFVGLSFKDERATRYRYRLLENDHEWQPLTKQTSITYAALRPGTYRFEVKAINADGIESTQPASMGFTILSPFWLRWWFIVLANIIAVVAIAAAYRYRMNHLLTIERMRTRIASDLHDDIGASLTRIALFSEVAKEEAEKASPRLVEMAEKIGSNARELLDSVDTLVWSIDPRHERFEEVITHLKSFAQEMLSMKGIDYTIDVAEQVMQLQPPLDARKNIMLIFKEAVNNIVKHARCHHVNISLQAIDGVFEMSIGDDGKGLASTILRPGHGLMNMRNRAQSIGGELDIQSEKDRGVTILLKVPIKR